MTANHLQTGNLADLKDYIYKTLCEHEKLEIGVFPMTESVLTRRAQPCAIYFCLHGPRSVKFTAIWDADRNAIFFYGATGERFHQTDLMDAPSLKVGNSTQ